MTNAPIAEIINLPGVLIYGKTKKEAVKKVKILTLRVLADLLELGKFNRQLVNLNFPQNQLIVPNHLDKNC